MNELDYILVTKQLTFMLRHDPKSLIHMDNNGYLPMDYIVNHINVRFIKSGLGLNDFTPVTAEDIINIVAESAGKYDMFQNVTGSLNLLHVCATSGHSLTLNQSSTQISLDECPELLFYGTSVINYQKIAEDNRIAPIGTDLVPLTGNIDIAAKAGGRYGSPVVLIFRAEELYKEGLVIYKTSNREYHTGEIPFKLINEVIHVDSFLDGGNDFPTLIKMLNDNQLYPHSMCEEFCADDSRKDI